MLYCLFCFIVDIFLKQGEKSILFKTHFVWIILRENHLLHQGPKWSKNKWQQDYSRDTSDPFVHTPLRCGHAFPTVFLFSQCDALGVWVWCKVRGPQEVLCFHWWPDWWIGVNHHKMVRTLSKSLSTLSIKDMFKTNKTQEDTSKWFDII